MATDITRRPRAWSDNTCPVHHQLLSALNHARGRVARASSSSTVPADTACALADWYSNTVSALMRSPFSGVPVSSGGNKRNIATSRVLFNEMHNSTRHTAYNRAAFYGIPSIPSAPSSIHVSILGTQRFIDHNIALALVMTLFPGWRAARSYAPHRQ
ncbi:hypothetical protein D9756_010163 [Leucocoprinus leucothites]|uniref:Uncharacterized protein n=1 Tax=Leucocoprinus leucothites TaxID=201217 RepID=A0A8H5CU90_9AGAR|nr:hypothetical protein D9756_010163 [Leucoagaricus leucothites]